jgi:hypothetical protein
MTFVGVALMLGLLALVAMTAKISLRLMAALDGKTQGPEHRQFREKLSDEPEYAPQKNSPFGRLLREDEVSELGAEGASCPVRTLMERLQNVESGDSRKS